MNVKSEFKDLTKGRLKNIIKTLIKNVEKIEIQQKEIKGLRAELDILYSRISQLENEVRQR